MASLETTVRAATAGDASAVAAILEYYVTETVVSFRQAAPVSAEWERLIRSNADRGLPFLVAEVGGEVVGYAYASAWKSYAAYRHTVENSVYVAEGLTGKGIGGTLLRALIEACRNGGFEQMIAVISRSGDVGGASVAIHRLLGFEDVGTLRKVGAKHGLRIDTHIMQLEL